MPPLTILTAQTLVNLLTANAAIETEVSSIAQQAGAVVPVIPSSQVYLSSAPAAMADLQQELGYPRITVYSSKLSNNQVEKFRTLSGVVTVTADINATADLVTNVDSYIHFYIEAVSNILRANRGDWGNGIFYSGAYEIAIQPPVTGGSGFLQLARISLEVGVSGN
jgi:hypothetical protein